MGDPLLVGGLGPEAPRPPPKSGPALTLTLILRPKPYVIIFTRIIVSNAYTIFNVIC